MICFCNISHCETTFIALWCQNRLWYEILESCTSFSHGICPSHMYSCVRKYFQPIHCLPFYFWPSKPLYISLSYCHLLPTWFIVCKLVFVMNIAELLPSWHYTTINNSYRINVYHFRAFWLDKSTVACLFLIRSYLDEHFAITWCPSSFVH